MLKVYDGSLHAEALGTANVTYSSRYNPDVKNTLTVTVLPPHIDKIEIFGNDTVSPNSHFKYICGESDFVVWEVVSGKAEISKSGYLVAKTFGDVTIRCSSMADPSVYAEKTVSVELFSSSYEFVRKLMGHAGLSALLGFGLFGTTFLLFRRKWASLPSSVALSLVYALVSEFIQYFTPGRYCTLSDLLVDFLGALVGIAVAIGVVAVVTTVWYVANKKSAKSLGARDTSAQFFNRFQKSARAGRIRPRSRTQGRELPCKSRLHRRRSGAWRQATKNSLHRTKIRPIVRRFGFCRASFYFRTTFGSQTSKVYFLRAKAIITQ